MHFNGGVIVIVCVFMVCVCVWFVVILLDDSSKVWPGELLLYRCFVKKSLS